MNVVLAQLAGVDSLVVCSPPQTEYAAAASEHPDCVCALLGITAVWAAGGPQAIALLASRGMDANG
jgi:histidinol dehydrogenase